MNDRDDAKARAAKARADALSPERRSEIASEAAKARWSEEGPDVRTQDHLVVYTNAKGAQTDLRFAGETMWATQRQMAEMFDVTVANVNIHLGKIFREGELDRDAVIKRDLITAADGKAYPTMLYELEAIISLGMRVSSKKGTHFRIWARTILKEFIIKGFVIDDERRNSYRFHRALAAALAMSLRFFGLSDGRVPYRRRHRRRLGGRSCCLLRFVARIGLDRRRLRGRQRKFKLRHYRKGRDMAHALRDNYHP